MVRRNKSKAKSKLIDFSINYGPFNFSKKLVIQTIFSSNIFATYPAPFSKNILPSLAKFLKIQKENLILSNGSTEIFYLLPQIFKFKKAVLLAPSFWEYEFTLNLQKIPITFFYLDEKNDFKLDISKLENKIKEADCIYICNPNNPTSTYIDRETILKLVYKFNNKKFIIDETYLLFSKHYNRETLNHHALRYDNLFIVTSLSKFFSMGGVRLGFCISSQKNIDFIKKYKNPYSVNIFAESILPILLKQKEYIKITRNFLNKEKKRVYQELNTLSYLKVFSPSANFILVKIISNKVSPDKLRAYLQKNNILVRYGTEFRGLSNKYLRINIKTKKENNLLLRHLKEFITLKSKN